MVDLSECEQFKDVAHKYGNCRHERLTPEKCDRWRQNHGLPPLHPENATPPPADHQAKSGSRRVQVTGYTGRKRTDAASRQKVPHTPTARVGSELKKLLAEIGLKYPDCGKCSGWSAAMNNWGVEGCRGAHREEIIQRLNEARQQVDWLTQVKAGTKLFGKILTLQINPFDPAPGLLDLAIARAEAVLSALPTRAGVAPTLEKPTPS